MPSVTIKTRTPVARLLIETPEYWPPVGKKILRRLINNGEAARGFYTTVLEQGKYVLTETDIIPVTDPRITMPGGFQAETISKADPRQNVRAGESTTELLTVMESGQYERSPYIVAEPPGVKKALDGIMAGPKPMAKPGEANIVAGGANAP